MSAAGHHVCVSKIDVPQDVSPMESMAVTALASLLLEYAVGRNATCGGSTHAPQETDAPDLRRVDVFVGTHDTRHVAGDECAIGTVDKAL